MAQLKVGIIGCGGIAIGKHLPALAKNRDVEMVAFCDLILERAEKAAAEYGTPDAKIYLDYKELLADPKIDVVHVLTPNREHSFMTIDALHAGKHVLCEKPMAKTYTEAKQMLEAAKATGKLLSIGYQARCSAASLYLKSACEADELGEIYFAKAQAIRRRAVPTWGVFLNEEEQGGGPLIDIGTHALDLTLWLMDNYQPQMVVGTAYKKLGNQRNTANLWGDWNPEKFTVEDSAFGFIKMQNGATIILESSWALNTLDVKEATCSLCGTKAGADMENGVRINGVKFNKQYVEEPNLKSVGVAFYGGDPYAAPEELENRNFYDAILYGIELRVKPEQALVVTRILEAIYESAKSGKAVYFDSPLE